MENNNNNNSNQQLQVVAVHMDGSDITQYQLSDGRIVGETEIVELARQKSISNLIVAQREGTEYVRSIPDGDPDNNLQNLPRF